MSTSCLFMGTFQELQLSCRRSRCIKDLHKMPPAPVAWRAQVTFLSYVTEVLSESLVNCQRTEESGRSVGGPPLNSFRFLFFRFLQFAECQGVVTGASLPTRRSSTEPFFLHLRSWVCHQNSLKNHEYFAIRLSERALLHASDLAEVV